MRNRWILILPLIALCSAAGTAQARKVTIKLGTMAPDGSTWHQLLKQMAADWKKASDGQVRMKIYPSGVAGNEIDMLRKMRIGQLQAAALSVTGLAGIDPAPQAIACPGLIADDAEWNHVFPRATKLWDDRFREKGFVVLMWGDTGKMNMFTKRKIDKPSDMKGMKIFAWSGDTSATEAMQLAGLQPVAISATDMLPSLSTGMIEAYATTPIMALTARWYEQTPYMTESSWGHLPGATVVRRQTWEQIPEATRAKLLEIAHVYAKKVNDEVSRMQAESIEAMQKNGLTVVEFDEAGKREWQAIGQKTWQAIRGGVVSEADFDAVKKIRDDYRAGKTE